MASTVSDARQSIVDVSAGLPVLLLFPGQGAQHERMAAGLYEREPVFTAAIDEVVELLGADGVRVRTDWLADRPQVGVDDPLRAQLLLFAVDYAMGRVAMSWARPAGLLGHSVGELAAATLAGVFTLPDALSLVLDRMARLRGAPAGGMLAVAESAAALCPYVDGERVAVAAVNATRQTILAGTGADLARVRAALSRDGIASRPVSSRLPFHSPILMKSAMAGEPDFARVRMLPPSIPVYSAYSGARLTDAQACDAAFWAAQPARPVLFWPALDRVLSARPHLVVDVGPGGGLAALARQHPTARTGTSQVVAVLPTRPRDPEHDLRTLRAARAAIKGQE
jgi:acyl transferase domain-containing protein